MEDKFKSHQRADGPKKTNDQGAGGEEDDPNVLFFGSNSNLEQKSQRKAAPVPSVRPAKVRPPPPHAKKPPSGTPTSSCGCPHCQHCSKSRSSEKPTDGTFDQISSDSCEDKSKPKKPLRVFHPSVSAALDYFVKSVTEAGVSGLRREFDELKEQKAFDLSHGAFTLNKERNRYMSNVCLDATRVILEFQVPPLTDYINANWILASNVDTTFIATQGPLENTMEDFWRMCYQEDVTTILMLCNQSFGGKTGCAQYWPLQEHSTKKFEYFTINNKKIRTQGEFVSVSLELIAEIDDGQTVPIELIQYTGWGDADVPASGSNVLRVLRRVQKKGPGPCVVHCSGGAGRTGTAIAIAVIVDRLFKGVHVKLSETLQELRLMRAHFVVTDSQYVFIAACVLSYIRAKALGYEKEVAAFKKSVREAYS